MDALCVQSSAGTALHLSRIVGASMAETMQDAMKREQDELLATLNRANSALMRIFNVEEEEDDE